MVTKFLTGYKYYSTGYPDQTLFGQTVLVK